MPTNDTSYHLLGAQEFYPASSISITAKNVSSSVANLIIKDSRFKSQCWLHLGGPMAATSQETHSFDFASPKISSAGLRGGLLALDCVSWHTTKLEGSLSKTFHVNAYKRYIVSSARSTGILPCIKY